MNDIYKLLLHEERSFSDVRIMRVPGGWIYRFWDIQNDCDGQGVFVPYSDEFASKA